MPGEPISNENAYILDAESATEMARLMKQDRLITEGMGGLFPERDDISGIHDILDIACGSGGWALEVAFESWMAIVFRVIQMAGFTSSPDGHNYGIMPHLR